MLSPRPDHLGAEKTVEQDVAAILFRSRPLEHEHDVYAQSRTGCSSQTSMVALWCAGGDDRRGGTILGCRHGDLKFAGLVAAATETDQVVTFHEQIIRSETERDSEARRSVHRRRASKEEGIGGGHGSSKSVG